MACRLSIRHIDSIPCYSIPCQLDKEHNRLDSEESIAGGLWYLLFAAYMHSASSMCGNRSMQIWFFQIFPLFFRKYLSISSNSFLHSLNAGESDDGRSDLWT